MLKKKFDQYLKHYVHVVTPQSPTSRFSLPSPYFLIFLSKATRQVCKKKKKMAGINENKKKRKNSSASISLKKKSELNN